MRGAYEESARLLLSEEDLQDRFAHMAEALYPVGGAGAIVALTSVHAGEGRSTVCIGLGRAFVERGVSTAAVDYNPARPGLHLMLGEPNFRGVTGYSLGEHSPESFGFDDSRGLLIIPSGPIPADPEGWLASEEAVGALIALRKSREVVLVDAPVCEELALLDELLEVFDGVLLIVHVGRTGKGEAREAMLRLRGAGGKFAGVVLNGC